MSVADRLADAVVLRLASLDWGAGVVPTVVKAKRPTVTEQDVPTATAPLVIVTAAQTGEDETRVGVGSAVKYLVTYPVAVTIALPKAPTLGNTDTMRGWREAVRNGLRKADWGGPGLPELNDLTFAGDPPWDAGSLDKNFDWSVQTMRVGCLEG